MSTKITPASIYIHIPFCLRACTYCNFNFSTLLKYKDKVILAICKELQTRKKVFQNKIIRSIYIGGGTPTLLTEGELTLILTSIYEYYTVAVDAEITIEANPENIDEYKLASLSKNKITRLSIGAQSFHDEDLKFMNRGHSAKEAINSIIKAQKFGFNNINVDIIYGFGLLSRKKLKTNLEVLNNLSIPHISTYALTVEERTLLAYKIKTKKIPPPNEIKFTEHFALINYMLKQYGFLNYEISNWSKGERYASRHNLNYWNFTEYLGIGPSAHSYYEGFRLWNYANNHIYTALIEKQGEAIKGKEKLSLIDKHNEFIMLSLRTYKGINYKQFTEKFGEKALHALTSKVNDLGKNRYFIENNEVLLLNNTGKQLANYIISELFID